MSCDAVLDCLRDGYRSKSNGDMQGSPQLKPAALDFELLEALDQAIANLGGNCPHRQIVLHLVESRDVACVGVRPHAHDPSRKFRLFFGVPSHANVPGLPKFAMPQSHFPGAVPTDGFEARI